MSLKPSRVQSSRPKLTGPALRDDDSDYEGESSRTFLPIRPVKTTNGQDDGVTEEDSTVIHNRRGKYKFDEMFNKLTIKTPLPHASTTYSRILELNIRKFRDSLDYVSSQLAKSTKFYTGMKLGDIQGMPSGAGHYEYETFIQLLAFHGYRVTREDKGPKYESETQVNIICIPSDK